MVINSSEREAILFRFWERAMVNRMQPQPVDADEWNEEVRYLSGSGAGTEEVLNHLYTQQPAFPVFLSWLEQYAVRGSAVAGAYEGPALTAEDWDFWNENGYLILRNAVPAGQCDAARAAIWQYLGADPVVPESWYQPHASKTGMMVRFFQHEALHNNRNSPKIRQAFLELYQGAEIYLLVDKVGFNPPETPTHHFNGSPLHFDVSLQPPIPFVLQGLLYLTDVAAGDGAFHCVPGFHKYVDEWIANLPEDMGAREAAIQALKPVAVPAHAGDLIIWHQGLPHCATANKGALPRIVQYITYKPVTVR